MTHTGEEPPSAPLSNAASRALDALANIASGSGIERLSGHQLLMERAWLTGATFQSGQSTGGSCRFLRCADGTIAVTLARASDWELMPAWLELDSADSWSATERSWLRLAGATLTRPVDVLVERGRLLGLAIAGTGQPTEVFEDCFETLFESPHPDSARTRRTKPPRVVDLSALWAGPLCSHLLTLCGAEVIKVESTHRPDGARQGNPAFYALLNQGKRSVALDFRLAAGREVLLALLQGADIIIESSRPRALAQLGIQAEAVLRTQPGLTWISITGHGRSEPEANWVAFGDDAGVAAGLSNHMRAAVGSYQFAGDAIADPLTGVHAALAAWRSWQSGGSRLVALSLVDVAAWCLAGEANRIGVESLRHGFASWWHHVHEDDLTASRCDRPISAPIAALGEHNDPVLARIRC